MKRLDAFGILLFGLLAQSERALGYDPNCFGGPSWAGYSEIKVYVHEDLASNLLHFDDTVWTQDELEEEIMNALETFQENLPSNAPPMRFVGTVSGPWDTKVANSVVVTTDLTPNKLCADIPSGTGGGGSTSQGQLITVKRSQDGVISGVHKGWQNCGKRYEHSMAFNDGGSLQSFRQIMFGELPHTYGWKHYNAGTCVIATPCDSRPCACMDSDDGDDVMSHHCSLWDWDNQVTYYGSLNSTAAPTLHRQSTNGTTWSSVSGAPTSLRFPGLGVSSGTTNFLAVAFKNLTLGGLSINQWSRVTNAWTLLGTQAAQSILGSGASVDPTPSPAKYYGSWMSGSITHVPKRPAVQTGSSTYLPAADVTRQPGVSMAYEPTNDVHLVAFRNTSLEPVIQVFSGTAFSTSFTLSEKYASEPPSVACTDSSLSYNCIIVWADAAANVGYQYRTLRWQQFSIANVLGHWFISLGAYKADGYLQYGAPSVAYKGPAGDPCAWVFAFKNPGPDVYTVCKAGSDTANLNLATERAHTILGRRVFSPRIGSANGYLELFINAR